MERVPYEDHWPGQPHRWAYCPWCDNYIDRRAKGRHARWHHRPENVWTQDEIDRASALGTLMHIFFSAGETDPVMLKLWGWSAPLILTDDELEQLRKLFHDHGGTHTTEALVAAAAEWQKRIPEERHA